MPRNRYYKKKDDDEDDDPIQKYIDDKNKRLGLYKKETDDDENDEDDDDDEDDDPIQKYINDKKKKLGLNKKANNDEDSKKIKKGRDIIFDPPKKTHAYALEEDEDDEEDDEDDFMVELAKEWELVYKHKFENKKTTESAKNEIVENNLSDESVLEDEIIEDLDDNENDDVEDDETVYEDDENEDDVYDEVEKDYDDYNNDRFELGEDLINNYNLPVIPLYPFDRSGDKAGTEPCISDWNERTQTTIEELNDWFENDSYINLGLPSGKNSGVIAIDINGYNNGGKELLDEISGGNLPDTVQYIIPNDGMRYLYAINYENKDIEYNNYFEQGNSDDISVSLIGDGQPIVLPYSFYPKTGEAYEFVEGHSFDDIDFATIPEWAERLMIADTSENPIDNLKSFFSDCPRLMEILEQQEEYGDITYKVFVNVLALLIKMDRKDLAYEFSKLYYNNDDEKIESIITKVEKKSEAFGYVRCVTLGCSNHFVKKCHGKINQTESGEIKNSPYKLLKINDSEDKGLIYNKHGVLSGVNGNIFSRYIHSKIKVKRRTRDVFYRYNNKKHLWVYEEEYDFRDYLIEFFNHIEKDSWLERFESQYFRNIVAETPKVQQNDFDYINLKNGLFNIKNMEFLNHNDHDTSKIFTTSQLPIAYDSKADCPKFKKFLTDILGKEPEILLLMQELIGYCMTCETKAHKIFIFQGDGSNGKSVLCKIITNLIGEENTSAISLRGFEKDFNLAEIVDKLVNISTESEVKSLDTEKLKAISSGDTIQINSKYEKVYSYKPFAKLIFCVNTLPYMTDKTEAIRRRLVIIPFNKSFVENPKNKNQMKMDKDIDRKLIQELSGIFNFALEGLARLEKNDYKFTHSKIAQETLEEYLQEINPYLSYIRTEIVSEAHAREEYDRLYYHFQAWCNKNGHNQLSQITKTKFIKEFRDTLKREQIPHEKNHSGYKYYIEQIRLKNLGEKLQNKSDIDEEYEND